MSKTTTTTDRKQTSIKSNKDRVTIQRKNSTRKVTTKLSAGSTLINDSINNMTTWKSKYNDNHHYDKTNKQRRRAQADRRRQNGKPKIVADWQRPFGRSPNGGTKKREKRRKRAKNATQDKNWTEMSVPTGTSETAKTDRSSTNRQQPSGTSIRWQVHR